ncbi:hypothetical protein J6590_002402 [Homalodisca vitripennis]|nr:hypothetical protein J6590_002402 [Homalodisca vitripennis]
MSLSKLKNMRSQPQGQFGSKKLYVCDCGRSYRYKQGLSEHQKLNCRQNNLQFQCPECLVKFAQASAVSLHIMKVHGHTSL